MLPGDRVLCIFVKNQSVGFTFKEWPLHVTIVPWFRIDIASVDLAEQLISVYVGHATFKVLVSEEKEFGYKHFKTVNIVNAPELYRLEGQTRRFLNYHKAWIVDEADKTRRNYAPHVSMINSKRLHAGDEFFCDRVSIVIQCAGYKQIDGEILL